MLHVPLIIKYQVGILSGLLDSIMLEIYHIVSDECGLRLPLFEHIRVYITPNDNIPMQKLVMKENKQNLYKICSRKKDTWHV